MEEVQAQISDSFAVLGRMIMATCKYHVNYHREHKNLSPRQYSLLQIKAAQITT
jgi:hypothetical protein